MQNKYNCMEQPSDTMRVETVGKDLLIAIQMDGNHGPFTSVYLTKKQVKQLRKDLKQHLQENCK